MFQMRHPIPLLLSRGWLPYDLNCALFKIWFLSQIDGCMVASFQLSQVTRAQEGRHALQLSFQLIYGNNQSLQTCYWRRSINCLKLKRVFITNRMKVKINHSFRLWKPSAFKNQCLVPTITQFGLCNDLFQCFSSASVR